MKRIYWFIFIITTHALSAQVDLLSLSGEAQTTGDLVTFKVESELGFDDLQKYKNKRIGDILYVLEVNRDGNGIFIRGILASPEQKKSISEKNIAPNDNFTIKNLNYKPSENEKLKDFIIYNGPDVKFSEGSKRALKIFMAFIGLVIGLLIIKKMLRIRNLKAKENKRLEILEGEIRSNSSKNEFELFYIKRKSILNDFRFETSKYEDFLLLLNQIQYKETWSEEELKQIKESYSKLIITMGRKNGV
jgi:hypothetical protein